MAILQSLGYMIIGLAIQGQKVTRVEGKTWVSLRQWSLLSSTNHLRKCSNLLRMHSALYMVGVLACLDQHHLKLCELECEDTILK